MIKNFEKCLEWLLEHEGGYVDHPEDPAGKTNKGITIGTYEGWLGRAVSEDMIRNIPDDHVEKIYREKYWDKIYADELPSGIDWSVFDWAVNSGSNRAVKNLQSCVGVSQDGFMGPKTLNATDQMDTLHLIDELYNKRQRFYENLSTFKTFGKGWTRRNKQTKEQSLSLVKA